MCLRVTTMDDVDVNLFRFDYDNTFYQFFLNAGGHIYARYGIRLDGDGEAVQSVAGVRDAMRKVLEMHKKDASRSAPPWKPVETQDLASFKKDPRRPNGCLHCHHAGYYVRREQFTFGMLPKEMVWGYPPPWNLGLKLDIDRNTVVESASDPAAAAGIEAGDRILAVDGRPVVTPADIAWTLHGFTSGRLKIQVERDGKEKTASIDLKGFEWRKSDISWRRSWWDSGPNIGLSGEDLDDAERKKIGVAAGDLAFRVMKVNPKGPAPAAGIKEGDIVVSVDGKSSDMGEIEFQMHVRLAHRLGETVPLGVVRGGGRLVVNVKLK